MAAIVLPLKIAVGLNSSKEFDYEMEFLLESSSRGCHAFIRVFLRRPFGLYSVCFSSNSAGEVLHRS